MFLAKDIGSIERTPKSEFERLRRQARQGKVQLLDSEGMFFAVVDKLVISSQSPFLKWISEFRTMPILARGRQVDLGEFKKLAERAITVRQRGEYGCDFVGEFKDKLPSANSYREVLACVPRGM